MEDVAIEMNKIKAKKNPTVMEIRRYVRYAVNVLKYDSEKLYEEVVHWKKEELEKEIKEVERENLKPKPKRYYVSLKDPLEDGGLR